MPTMTSCAIKRGSSKSSERTGESFVCNHQPAIYIFSNGVRRPHHRTAVRCGDCYPQADTCREMGDSGLRHPFFCRRNTHMPDRRLYCKQGRPSFLYIFGSGGGFFDVFFWDQADRHPPL